MHNRKINTILKNIIITLITKIMLKHISQQHYHKNHRKGNSKKVE